MTYGFGMAPAAPGPARRGVFHRLPVAAVRPVAEDAVSLTVDVPADLAAAYAFRAGQHVTFRVDVGGRSVRRTYSICDPVPSGVGPRSLRVGIRVLPDGVFSPWVRDVLRPGDEIDVMTPLGGFGTSPRPGSARHHVGVAAGSGVTPLLSIAATVLRDEPGSRVTLLLGNRRPGTVMFADELAALQEAHDGRFAVEHVLSRATGDGSTPRRLDAAWLGGRLDVASWADAVDAWYLCGPWGLVTASRDLLVGRGVRPGAIGTEVFHAPSPTTGTDRGAPQDPRPARVRFTVGGRTQVAQVPSRSRTVLAQVRQVDPSVPFSCTNGVCGSCRALVTQGRVRMDRNLALDDEEVRAGYVLTCQAHPETDEVAVDYDA